MRLLFLAAAPPDPARGGGSLRMYHLVRFLSGRYEVDVLGLELEGHQEARRLLEGGPRDVCFVRPKGRAWSRWVRLGPYERDPALAAVLQERLRTGRYDAVQVEKPAMLPYLPKHLEVPVVLDLWAYGLVGAQRALYHGAGVVSRVRHLVRLVRFAAFDAWSWPSVHALLVVSEADRARALEHHPHRRIVVVRNGVDCDRIRPAAREPEGEPILLFTGDMSFEPNIEAVERLAREILPAVRRQIPSVRLHIVGRSPSRRVQACQGPGVVVVGQVPDMQPHLQGAAVYVAPQVTGAGTRTKLLEALAAGLPIVTTTIASEGLGARHEQDLVIADTPSAQIDAILGLLRSPARRRELGRRARALAEERFDWPRCLAPLEDLYGSMQERPAC